MRSCRSPQRPQPDLSILHRPILIDDDANAAFAILTWIASLRTALQRECDARIATARQRLADGSRVAVDGESFPFSEVSAAIEQSLVTYAETQRKRLFATHKTAKFDLGEIRIRKRPASVTFAEGETAQTVLLRVEDRRE